MKKKIVSSIFIAFGFLILFGVKNTFAATLYWVGTDGSNASVAASWSTTNPTSCAANVTPSGAIPGSADQMNFDADCDNGAVIDSSFSSTVSTIVLNSGYAGTVTLSNPLSVTLTVAVTGGTFSGTSQLTVGSTLTVNGGVANFGSFSAYTQTSTATLSSGTLTLPSGADLNGALTISGGTFNAPSGTMTVAASLTITNYPASTVFNANSGTITFDGSSATLACSNVPFNVVTINGQSTGTKTVNSDCNLPLGSNPTISNAITLNGTLSGSGTLTVFASCCASIALTLKSGYVLSGFTALSTTGFVVDGATVDLSSYSSFTASSTVCVGGTTTSCTTPSSGSLSLPGGADLNGALNISAGTFTAPSGTMTLAGSLTVSGGTGTFNANGGTITLDGAAATIGCTKSDASVISFSSIVYAPASSSKTISSGCVLPLGANPVLTRGINLSGTLSGTGTISNLTGTIILNSGSSLSGFSGISAAALSINGATVDFSNYNPVAVSDNFAIVTGTFTAPSGMMTVGNGWSFTGGTFNHNNGTVALNRSTQQTITGSTTFYNLSKTVTSDNTLVFTAGTTQTVAGTLTLKGDGGRLSLHSSSAGTIWNIDARGGRSLSNLDVQDSNNTNSNAMVASNSLDSGNNTNWLFTSAPVISFALDYPGGESHITETRPTFRWKNATPSVNSSMVKYQLWLDNGETGDFNIDNIVPFVSDVNGNNKTLEYDRYTLHDDGDYLNLTTKSSSLWPSGMNNGELTLGKKNWRIVAYDSVGNVREESVDFYVDALSTSETILLASAPRITTQTSVVTEPVQLPFPEPKNAPTPTPEPRLPIPSQDNFLVRFLKWLISFLEWIIKFITGLLRAILK